MNVYRFFQMIAFSIRFGKKIPVVIYSKAKIRFRKSAIVHLDSRLRIGNPSSLASVSANNTNLYVGHESKVFFGKGVCIGPGVSLVVKDKATMKIGDDTYFTSDAHIETVNKIEIGNNCAISWGVTIIDDNHHEVVMEGAEKTAKTEVVIGNHVWIGCNCTVLPGSKIGSNSIVAAGTVVRGIFPENVLIAGNPARVIKTGVTWK